MVKANIIQQTLNYLRRQDFKITPARRRIIEIMAEAKKPISADHLYQKAIKIMDRTTVYRTLWALEKANCLTRFAFKNHQVYELAASHNHYLICCRCQKIENFSLCPVKNINRLSLQASKKFALINHHLLQLTGVCKKCAY